MMLNWRTFFRKEEPLSKNKDKGNFKLWRIRNKNSIKKETTYQKLAVFKEIDSSDRPVSLDEEMVLLQAYNHCFNKNNELSSYINEKNMDRMKKIY